MKKLLALLTLTFGLLGTSIFSMTEEEGLPTAFPTLGATPTVKEIEGAVKTDLRAILKAAGSETGKINVEEAQNRIQQLDKSVDEEIQKYRKAGDEATAKTLDSTATPLIGNFMRALELLSFGSNEINLKGLKYLAFSYSAANNPDAAPLARITENDFAIARNILENLDFSTPLAQISPLSEQYYLITMNYFQAAKDLSAASTLAQVQDVKQYFTDQVAQPLSKLSQDEQDTFMKWVGGETEYLGTKIDNILKKLTAPPAGPTKDITEALISLSSDMSALAGQLA